MYPSKSILSRILFLHLIAVVIAAICMPLVLSRLVSSDVKSHQQRALLEQAKAITRHLTFSPETGWALELTDGLRHQYSEAYGRYSYAVLDNEGRRLFASQKTAELLLPPVAASEPVSFLEVQQDQRVLSGVTFRTSVGDHPVSVQVAEDLAHRDVVIDDVLANLFRNIGWVTALILLLLVATDILIFRRAVQPLLLASAKAQHISPTRIDVRLPLDDIPTEIRPLIIAVNRALDRLESGFIRQREFAADVAHELRTPLTILRTRLDTLPDKVTTKALLADIERMGRVVSQLLDAAELETLVIDPVDVADLHGVSAEVAEFLAPLAIAQGKAIDLTGEDGPVWVTGDADMLRLAIRNLVENAINHAPKATNVEIAVGRDGSVSVLDRGEGIPADRRKQIFERFARLDPHGVDGAGLGLSIVKRIVEAHEGTIIVDSRPGGGAKFTMQLQPTSGPSPPPPNGAGLIGAPDAPNDRA